MEPDETRSVKDSSGGFRAPIPTPKGKPLVTLKDAAAYIMPLPKKEAASPEWQAAIEALMLVAELDGPTMSARIGVMRALNRAGPRSGGLIQRGKTHIGGDGN